MKRGAIAIAILLGASTLPVDGQTKKAPPVSPRAQEQLLHLNVCLHMDDPSPSDFATGEIAELRQQMKKLAQQLCYQDVDIQALQDKIDDLAAEVRRR
ncbi:MAG TPA: hypothetical protein VGP48_13235 [Stellaceae bacterium]|jgi:hypothetical protein|nr:hypothetical protein [Stellaceae bacterium]